jgi:hypothetical protein
MGGSKRRRQAREAQGVRGVTGRHEHGPQPAAPEWVVFVSSVVGLRVRANTQEDAATRCQKLVHDRLRTVDDNVHFAKVAVMRAEDYEDQLDNISRGEAPWLKEGGKDDGRDQRGADGDNTEVLPTEDDEPTPYN